MTFLNNPFFVVSLNFWPPSCKKRKKNVNTDRQTGLHSKFYLNSPYTSVSLLDITARIRTYDVSKPDIQDTDKLLLGSVTYLMQQKNLSL